MVPNAGFVRKRREVNPLESSRPHGAADVAVAYSGQHLSVTVAWAEDVAISQSTSAAAAALPSSAAAARNTTTFIHKEDLTDLGTHQHAQHFDQALTCIRKEDSNTLITPRTHSPRQPRLSQAWRSVKRADRARRRPTVKFLKTISRRGNVAGRCPAPRWGSRPDPAQESLHCVIAFRNYRCAFFNFCRIPIRVPALPSMS